MDDIEEKFCPICDGPCVPMGALGNRLHFRCRNCGAECSEVVEVESAPRFDPPRSRL